MEATTYLPSKPHYEILDGLRGVAAIMVVIFHLFEPHSTSHLDQIINHGYLAVDFFFVLSGFVIGYAYDDRWGKMTCMDFFKRRVIRLQPMLVIGMVIGAVCYYFQASVAFPVIGETPVWKMILVMVVGFTLIPLPVSMDIRGWTEMHPLNGPAWSLFFEYIANILYALFIRKFSKVVLSVFVFLSGCALVHMALTSPNGDVIGGWSLEWELLHIGFCRLLYPFFGGLLLYRIGKLVKVKAGFWACSLLLIIIMSWPRVGGEELWKNGLYDSFCIIILFPLIVAMGAGSDIKGKYSVPVCKFLGNISYPLYITHYPIVYIYTGYVADHHLSWHQTWPWLIAIVPFCVLMAYACLKLYDEPVRNWLKNKFLVKRKKITA